MKSLLLRCYGLLMWLAQPLLRRKLARRARTEPGYAVAIGERFGHYSQPPEAASELVWVHAVSLGETRTAAILLKAMRAAYPGMRVLLTHGTATGRAEGQALLQPGDVQVWQAWDSPVAVARFFSHFKPRLGLLMETEVWPTTVATARTCGVPLVLVNGRLSERSLRRALRVGVLSRPSYAGLAAVYAQTESDAMRFRQLGVAAPTVFGNLKFDATPSQSQHTEGKAWRQALGQPVVMFASSRDGEEDEFFKQIGDQAQTLKRLSATKKVAYEKSEVVSARRVRYLVVPRHPQRFDAVEALARQQGLTVSRRSSWRDGPATDPAAMQSDVWLGDSLGEMALYYAFSDLALLGGSFAPLGGQNLIEAAACGCPVVMGPHTFNFDQAAELAEAAGAARRVPDMPAAMSLARELLRDRQALDRAVAAGLDFAAINRGATEKTLAALRSYL